MEKGTATSYSRKKERFFLLLVGIVLFLLFLRLFYVEQKNFTDVDQRLKDGTMINLNAGNLAKNLSALLKRGYYFEDQKDIGLIENTIASSVASGSKFDNIGELNKRRYNVNADDAFNNGGVSF